MKIGGTDAIAQTVLRTQESSTDGNEANTNIKDNIDNAISSIKNKNVSLITQYEKNELPVSEKFLIDAIQKANKAILGGDRRFEFSIHEKTKEIIVKVIDADTNKVIREIPPEKTLDMVAKMCELAGVMVDEKG